MFYLIKLMLKNKKTILNISTNAKKQVSLARFNPSSSSSLNFIGLEKKNSILHNPLYYKVLYK